MSKNDDNRRNHLHDLAAKVVHEAGFITSLAPDAREALAELERTPINVVDGKGITDMRALLWCSIDNDDSRDLDQLQCAERLDGGKIRLLVAIADVDAAVKRGDPIDRHAAHNATSVYTGVRTFPMLPDQLSEGITSLLPGQDRFAVVVGLTLDDEGSVVECEAWRAIVCNRAKLIYESIGAWLDKGGKPPTAVQQIDGLEDQLLLQYEATERIERYRTEHGALNLETIEARPIARDGKIV
ncbi:MAG: RNB domain-containing ribonuclease, partial [bacterium]|nr:RNB domain-containing ribonuclease [Candidatus Kapabacteria bacterium]